MSESLRGRRLGVQGLWSGASLKGVLRNILQDWPSKQPREVSDLLTYNLTLQTVRYDLLAGPILGYDLALEFLCP